MKIKKNLLLSLIGIGLSGCFSFGADDLFYMKTGIENIKNINEHEVNLHSLYIEGNEGEASMILSGNSDLFVSTGLVIGTGNYGIDESLMFTIGGGANNKVFGNFSSIGGGLENEINSESSYIMGGLRNKINGRNSFIAGGYENTGSLDGIVLGGSNNDSSSGVVFGGYRNKAEGGVVMGGNGKSLSDSFSWNAQLPGGDRVQINADSGILIGTTQPIRGVNVVVSGAVAIGNSNSSVVEGEIYYENGCYFAYDGVYGNPIGGDCSPVTCKFGAVNLKVGDKVTGYRQDVSSSCTSEVFECMRDGSLSGFTGMVYPYCHPYVYGGSNDSVVIDDSSSCSVDGISVPNGRTFIRYKKLFVDCSQVEGCDSPSVKGVFRCDNGEIKYISGPDQNYLNYDFQSCSRMTYNECEGYDFILSSSTTDLANLESQNGTRCSISATSDGYACDENSAKYGYKCDGNSWFNGVKCVKKFCTNPIGLVGNRITRYPTTGENCSPNGSGCSSVQFLCSDGEWVGSGTQNLVDYPYTWCALEEYSTCNNYDFTGDSKNTTGSNVKNITGTICYVPVSRDGLMCDTDGAIYGFDCKENYKWDSEKHECVLKTDEGFCVTPKNDKVKVGELYVGYSKNEEKCVPGCDYSKGIFKCIGSGTRKRIDKDLNFNSLTLIENYKYEKCSNLPYDNCQGYDFTLTGNTSDLSNLMTNTGKLCKFPLTKDGKSCDSSKILYGYKCNSDYEWNPETEECKLKSLDKKTCKDPSGREVKDGGFYTGYSSKEYACYPGEKCDMGSFKCNDGTWIHQSGYYEDISNYELSTCKRISYNICSSYHFTGVSQTTSVNHVENKTGTICYIPATSDGAGCDTGNVLYGFKCGNGREWNSSTAKCELANLSCQNFVVKVDGQVIDNSSVTQNGNIGLFNKVILPNFGLSDLTELGIENRTDFRLRKMASQQSSSQSVDLGNLGGDSYRQTTDQNSAINCCSKGWAGSNCNKSPEYCERSCGGVWSSSCPVGVGPVDDGLPYYKGDAEAIDGVIYVGNNGSDDAGNDSVTHEVEVFLDGEKVDATVNWIKWYEYVKYDSISYNGNIYGCNVEVNKCSSSKPSGRANTENFEGRPSTNNQSWIYDESLSTPCSFRCINGYSRYGYGCVPNSCSTDVPKYAILNTGAASSYMQPWIIDETLSTPCSYKCERYKVIYGVWNTTSNHPLQDLSSYIAAGATETSSMMEGTCYNPGELKYRYNNGRTAFYLFSCGPSDVSDVCEEVTDRSCSAFGRTYTHGAIYTGYKQNTLACTTSVSCTSTLIRGVFQCNNGEWEKISGYENDINTYRASSCTQDCEVHVQSHINYWYNVNGSYVDTHIMNAGCFQLSMPDGGHFCGNEGGARFNVPGSYTITGLDGVVYIDDATGHEYHCQKYIYNHDVFEGLNLKRYGGGLVNDQPSEVLAAGSSSLVVKGGNDYDILVLCD